MRDIVRQRIFDYFRQLGNKGGNTVQAGDLLPRSVRHNLSQQEQELYDEVVQELLNEGFLYDKPSVPRSGTSLGNIGGYAISQEGVRQL
jgi:hypothetical protein